MLTRALLTAMLVLLSGAIHAQDLDAFVTNNDRACDDVVRSTLR